MSEPAGGVSGSAAIRTRRLRGGTGAVLLGGVVSSLAAYAFQIVGARSVGDEAYAPVGLLWTVQYLVLTTALVSVEAYVTRKEGVTAGVWAWIVGLAVTLGAATAVIPSPVSLGSSPAWPLAVAGIVLGFGLFMVVRGVLAATRRFGAYGVMTGGESVVRFVLAALLLVGGAGAPGLALSLPAGALVLALPWLRHLRRRSPSATVPVTDHRPVPFLVRTTIANGIAQVLLAAGPLVVAGLGGSGALVTVVFVTTTAARGPMVFVHSGALARILPAVRSMVAQGRLEEIARGLRRAVLPTVGLVGLVAVLGGVLGPVLVALAFGGALRPGTTFASLTAVAVVLAMIALLLNQVAIAIEAESRLLLPWVLGLSAAVVTVVLTAGTPLDVRVAAASAVGLTTAVVLIVGLLVPLLEGSSARTSEGRSAVSASPRPSV